MNQAQLNDELNEEIIEESNYRWTGRYTINGVTEFHNPNDSIVFLGNFPSIKLAESMDCDHENNMTFPAISGTLYMKKLDSNYTNTKLK